MWTLSQVSQAVKNQTWTGLPPSVVEYLVVAGAAGGGTNRGGGGGAGGLLQGYASITSGTSYFVTVGAGGSGGIFSSTTNATAGSTSVFDSTTSGASTGRIVASGGGRGGGFTGTANGASGGSGGGAGGEGNPAGGGSGTSGQGTKGGQGSNFEGTGGYRVGGGGGGAGSGGMNGISAAAGNGGMGIASSITGSAITYAGGGGGGTSASGALVGSGGIGGGGAGSLNGSVGVAGSINSGGGGGGGANNADGGAGGSGIVIIRYPGTTQFFTGGTLSYANGHVIHTFYANGTLVPIAGTLYVNPDYQIARSLRFNSADQTYLGRTPSTTSSRTTLTYSAWVKRGDVSTNSAHFGITAAATSGRDAIRFESNYIQVYLNEANGANVYTSAVFRDPSAWYHIVVAIDTTQATEANRVKVYVNNVLQTLTGTYPVQNYQFTGYNVTAKEHNIGKSTQGNYYVLDGYLAEINFIDGQALTPSSFGWTNPATGVWAPLDFVGTYGTNGFYLNFSDNSNITAATLGADTSGNGNNWTPNNFSVTAGVGNDSLVDSPTLYGTDTGVGGEVRGNYSTWSPLANLGLTLTNGNLTNSYTTSSWTGTTGTMAMDSGTWYFEYTVSATASYTQIGVIETGRPLPTGGLQLQNGTAYAWSYQTYGQLGNNSTYITSGITSATTNDIIMVAVDVSNGKIWFGKNGTWFNSGSPSTGTNAAYTNLSGSMIPAIYSYGTESGNTNFGQRPFAYTAPTGFKALNTQNLPTPTIGATAETLANKFFDASIYTGNGATPSTTPSSLTVLNSGGFQPDFVWIKSRSNAYPNFVWDVIRGVSNDGYLATASTDAQNSDNTGNQMSSFNSNGFSVQNTTGGSVGTNNLASTFVGWQWKAGGTAVTNTSGSITSSVSANPTAGFSIVRYSGNATSGATVGHGLGVAPSMVIGKTLNTAGYDWPVYHIGLTDASYVVSLNLTNAQSQQTNKWNSTAPTSTVVTLGNHGTNVSGTNNQILYCFAPIAGYSAFGKYTGNGSSSGPFVFTGMRPAFLMIKCSSTAGTDWAIYDNKRNTFNVVNTTLEANLSLADYTSTNLLGVDFLSNGFRLIGTDNGVNGSGLTYIYMAFAENPFKYSLAR
jgi:hypothetical protein